MELKSTKPDRNQDAINQLTLPTGGAIVRDLPKWMRTMGNHAACIDNWYATAWILK
jgi:hypothetical protein